MMRRRIPPLLLTAAAVIGLGGCQYLSFLHPRARLKPAVSNTQPQDIRPTGPDALIDRLYADAVTALKQRDYATALDALQLARARRPADPRVLTAMGVIYDKLGRFDLSARYYDEAEAADPGSKVVAIDRAYSERLQRAGAEESDAAPMVTQVVTEQHVTALDRVVAVNRADQDKADQALRLPSVTLIAEVNAAGIEVLDATGEAGGANALRSRLVQAGWTIRHTGPTPVASPVSRVVYPAAFERVARALARTLPFRATLQTCDSCNRLRVVVGRGARERMLASRATQARPG